MKMELRVGSHVVVIDAEGAVSVSVRDDGPVVSAPVSVPVAPVVPPSEQLSFPDVPPVPQPAALHLLPPPPSEPAPSDDALVIFRRLSDLRRQLASEQNVPPYVIFHDKTLREMATTMPVSLEALGSIGGVGMSKLEKYGARFLSALHGAA